MEQDPVVVVGAGPTGLTLACALRSAGVPARVVDAAPGPATTSRAVSVSPRGVEVLHRLGALADLPECSLPMNQMIFSASGNELIRLQLRQLSRLGGHPGLLISQAKVEDALRRRLSELGGKVEWARAVSAVSQDANSVVVRLNEGLTVRASWLVGCDGAHSTVRKEVGIGFSGVARPEWFLLADVHLDLGPPRDAVSVWLRGSGVLAACPLPGDDLWRLVTPTPVGLTEPDPDAVLARLRERVMEETGRWVPMAEWTSSFQIHQRLADTYRRGRILLAGDAAHIHSPVGGQGMNTGIGDAENLAWKLALVVTGRAGDGLLDTYQTERRPIAAKVLGTTSGATNLFAGTGARFLRDHLAPLMNRPFIQQMIAERFSQLLVSYHGGPLARGRWRLSQPRPGDRLRDLQCHRVDGTPTRLRAELRGRWAVLAPGKCAHAKVARAWLGDSVTELTAENRDVLLVRPDGHLAWRGTDPAGLERWLASALDRRVPARVPAGSRWWKNHAEGPTGAQEGSKPGSRGYP